MPLWYFPAVTSWGLQRTVQRARGFRGSEGAGGWAEKPHLGKVKRDPGSEGNGEKHGWRQLELQLGSRRRERWPTLPCLHRGERSESQAALEHGVGSLSFRTGLEACRLSQSWTVSTCLPLRPQSGG